MHTMQAAGAAMTAAACVCALFVAAPLTNTVGAQTRATAAVPVAPGSLQWRNIGPNRGGRSIAVAGSSSRPHEYYFGATGGGLWRTTDGGLNWRPVTDGQIRSSSVGAVAVAATNPDVVYLGMGETQLRGNVMQGDGLYKSNDGGRTWQHSGLSDSQAIGRIRIDPLDADVVYVTALGHPYGRNAERGIFRSRDGGGTWERVLYRNDATGGYDLIIDPSDRQVLYATLWEVHRKPWLLWSGGAGSGIFKSVDGGTSWTELTRNPGLPSGVLGKIAIAVSPADPRRVYANIEAHDGGLYRSDDGGATWSQVNGHRDLWQRSFYFMRVVADPADRESVYVLNVLLHKSTDGGKTFGVIAAPHVDHHDLWIDPNNAQRMVNGNDGGANVSINGGGSWTAQKYPTAQLYRVATTHEFPYHVCAGQQDNSTVCVPSRGGHVRDPDARVGDWFYAVGGGENAVIAPSPRDPAIFFANETNSLSRYDRRHGQARDVQPHPRMVMGESAAMMPERWNWTYPIVISPLDPDVLYAGSQHLWTTRDEGKSWSRVSPDLTRAAPATMGDSGGPIILDQDGPEIYATIFSIAPSPLEAGTVWVGSDDGLVHVTRDGGSSWRKVTPPDVRQFTRISRIDASPHHAGTAYVAGNRYQMDDRAPYIWKTRDYGGTWTKINAGLRTDDFVHVVRADPARAGLLYAGTEHGVYFSLDDGSSWQSLSLNLPDVQVSDMVVKDSDLVIATHGRSFYVLENLTPLRQSTPQTAAASVHLFQPQDAVRRIMPAMIDYWLHAPAANLKIEILTADGQLVQNVEGGRAGLPRTAGYHRVSWNLRYPGATVFPGIVLEGSNPAQGIWAPPGDYQVRLTADGFTQTQPLQLRKDPRLTDVSVADLRAQFELARQVRDRTTAANQAVIHSRALRAEITERVNGPRVPRIAAAADSLGQRLAMVEGELYQVRNQSSKDKIAFPIKLNNRLSGLLGIIQQGDAAPTAAHERVFRELSAELDVQLGILKDILEQDLPRFNRLLVDAGIAPISREQIT